MSVICEACVRIVMTDSVLLLGLSKCSLDVLHDGWLCGTKEWEWREKGGRAWGKRLKQLTLYTSRECGQEQLSGQESCGESNRKRDRRHSAPHSGVAGAVHLVRRPLLPHHRPPCPSSVKLLSCHLLAFALMLNSEAMQLQPMRRFEIRLIPSAASSHLTQSSRRLAKHHNQLSTFEPSCRPETKTVDLLL